MKPEPLKDKIVSYNVGFTKEGITEMDRFKFDDIKSAIEYREELFRKKIAERTSEGLFGDKDKISITEIMDISRKVDKIAFEDVMGR